MVRKCSRWVALFLMGITACFSLTSCHSLIDSIPKPFVSQKRATYTWSGIGFGIEMSAEVHDVTPSQGRRIGRQIEKEIQSLERAFSLYSKSSELSQLNRFKKLENPSVEFLTLLRNSQNLSDRTLGYYQPAIHGAWSKRVLRARNTSEWKRLCEASSLDYVEATEQAVFLTNSRTELSFNAIVQGYLADKVQGYLRYENVQSAILHLGETYAIGQHPEGREWSLAVAGSSDLVGIVKFADAGLAVSAHDSNRELLNPLSWSIQRHSRVVAVISNEGAAVADAFATAFGVAPPKDWKKLYNELSKAGGCQVKIWEDDVLQFDRGE